MMKGILHSAEEAQVHIDIEEQKIMEIDNLGILENKEDILKMRTDIEEMMTDTDNVIHPVGKERDQEVEVEHQAENQNPPDIIIKIHMHDIQIFPEIIIENFIIQMKE